LVSVGVLVAGLLMRDQTAAGVAVMALPVAVAGLGVGVIHNYLEFTGKLECPKGISNIGTAPQQAAVAQAILVLFLLTAAMRRPFVAFVAIVMGAAVAWLLFTTSPKPVVPTKPYEGRIAKCRVPYKEPAPPSAK
jgi:hypothetical protein